MRIQLELAALVPTGCRAVSWSDALIGLMSVRQSMRRTLRSRMNSSSLDLAGPSRAKISRASIGARPYLAMNSARS